MKLTLFTLIAIASSLSVADGSAKQRTSAFFETVVIEDRGGQPIDKYLPKHNVKEQEQKNFKKRQSRTLAGAHFPVRTAGMSVGRISDNEASNIQYQLATSPMFIIGYDPVSIRWLKANRELLSQKRAIGLVVNIESNEEMMELQNIAGDGIAMQPTPGDRMAEQLNVRHYPFYLDNQGVLR
jgi:integrating conjugative element protein (TIGR03765 family)